MRGKSISFKAYGKNIETMKLGLQHSPAVRSMNRFMNGNLPVTTYLSAADYRTVGYIVEKSAAIYNRFQNYFLVASLGRNIFNIGYLTTAVYF